MQLFIIGLCGLLGVYARFGCQVMALQLLGISPIWATLGINVLGSFAIGLIYAISLERAAVNELWRIGIQVGFLGGFTTFSSFSLDTLVVLMEGKSLTALFYVVSSIGGGIGAAALGLLLARVFLN